MDITHIQRSLFYRFQHVTGPKCVLVSVRFGKAPPNGPTVIRLLAMGQTEATIQFDLSNHVSEILAGVARANDELGISLEVEAIEVVPDDYPGRGQAEHVAYRIAMAVGRGDV
ncbi:MULTISPECIES: hypothetical protein [Delftia]|uniref:hypothetical protein n=1 Tax=Delftia TaxID=80865 RepID=UPI0012E22A84|nr:hypothetical protein [Delftia lacustris]